MFFSNSDKWKKRGFGGKKSGGSDRRPPRHDPKELELVGLDPADIAEDLHGGPLLPGGTPGDVRIFGKFSEDQIHELMDWSGIFAALKEKGYRNCRLELQYLSDKDQRIFVYKNDEVLIHIRLKLSAFHLRYHAGAPKRKLLYIDWLMTRHPLTDKVRSDRLFPGQDRPGLGIFPHLSDFITNLALGVGASGAFNIPEYFHDAVLFHRQFNFYDPVREAHFRGLIRDLRKFGIREISHALSENRVLDKNKEPVIWTPSEMISAMGPELEEMLWSKDYFTRVVRELKKIHFTMKPKE